MLINVISFREGDINIQNTACTSTVMTEGACCLTATRNDLFVSDDTEKISHRFLIVGVSLQNVNICVAKTYMYMYV